MQKDRSILRTCLVLSLFLASNVLAMPRDIPDADIRMAVENELQNDEGVSYHLVDVGVRDGVVTLEGWAGNILTRERAVAIARAVKGVRAVINKIEVQPVPRTDEEIEKSIEWALLNDPATEAYELEVEVEDRKVKLDGTVDSWQERRLGARSEVGELRRDRGRLERSGTPALEGKRPNQGG